MLWEEAISNAIYWMDPFDPEADVIPEADSLKAVAWALIALQLPKNDLEKRIALSAYAYVENPSPENFAQLKLAASGWAELVKAANVQGSSTVSEGIDVDPDDTAFPGDA